MPKETTVKDITGKIVCIGDIISYSGVDKSGWEVKDCVYYIEDGGFPESFGMTDEEFMERYTCKVIGDLEHDSIEVELDLGY